MSASKPRETLAVAATDGDSERIAADICVIGAGPGGLAVATAAAAFGRSVVLIERHKVGGEALQLRLRSFAGHGGGGQPRPCHALGRHLRPDRARPGGRPALGARARAKCHRRAGAELLRRAVRRPRRARHPRRRPLHRQEDGRRRRASHQGAPLRHRHRIGAAGAGDPGARQRALLHQRDDLRQPGAVAQPHHHRRRPVCAGAGPGAQSARLARRAAGARARRWRARIRSSRASFSTRLAAEGIGVHEDAQGRQRRGRSRTRARQRQRRAARSTSSRAVIC